MDVSALQNSPLLWITCGIPVVLVIVQLVLVFSILIYLAINFEESVLPVSAAIYTKAAMDWLEKHC